MVSNAFQSFLKRLIDFQGPQRFTRKTRRNARTADLFRQPANRYCAAELLEDRLLLSASSVTMNPPFRLSGLTMPLSSAQPVASSTALPASVTTSPPTQIESADSVPPAAAAPTFIIEGRVPATGTAQPAASGSAQPGGVAPITPSEMTTAYGVNLISFGGVTGT
jgi:hypothetical protein